MLKRSPIWPVGLLVMLIWWPMATAGLQRPVIESPVIADYPTRPPTVDQMFKQAECVLLVIMTDVKAREVHASAAGQPVLVSQFTGQVLEGFKSPPGWQQPSVVIQHAGGVFDRGDFTEKSIVRGFPTFDLGEQYLLFLCAMKGHRDLWVPPWGPGGVFLYQNERLTAVGEEADKLMEVRFTLNYLRELRQRR